MIVFSDMDGTLLTSDKQMSDATWAMLDELARRGIEFVPCTGRPLSGIFEPILAHPAAHYAVCANGASVWQLDEDTPTDASRATCILSRPLDRGIAHRIHRIAAGHDVTFDIFADGHCFLPRSLYGRPDDEPCGGDPTSRLRPSAHEHRMRHGYRTAKIDEGRHASERIASVPARPGSRSRRRSQPELDSRSGGIEVTRFHRHVNIGGHGRRAPPSWTALTWSARDHLGERLARRLGGRRQHQRHPQSSTGSGHDAANGH
ncbi:MAG: HAD family hydrolase [Collinsella sp.]